MNIAALIKKIFDYIVWVAFFGFLLLGVIIYITNTTYPGDKLYSFKLMFEDFTLATSKILNKQIDFSIDLVSKRSQEVAKILSSKNSEETLNRLDVQVELTAVSISQIPDPVERKKAAEEYIVKLNEASIILSEKEKELLGSSTTYSSATNTEVQPTVTQNFQITPKPTTSSFITEPTPIPTITIQVITQQPVTQTTVGPISEPTSTQAVAQPTIVPTAVPTTTPTINIASTPNVSQQINNSQQTIQQAIIQMNNLATQDNRDFKKNKKPELPKTVKEGIKEKLNQELE